MIINLSLEELQAVLWAVGQFTTANANDIDEMESQGLTRSKAMALLRANKKLVEAIQ